ncbi:MAG: PDDEXK-like family protein [Planctomycetota bacterium]
MSKGEIHKYIALIDKSKKAALDRFLADNPELEELSAKLATFNAFRTLRIENAEIRHSNVLAWLLNPDESHGLADIILRRVFSNMLLESDANIEEISAAQVELMDFADIEVRREWKNIDLLIIDRTNKLVILIENKIYSSESTGQLSRYLKEVKKEFPGFVIVPVFFTLMGEEIADNYANAQYISYSYLQLLAVIDNLFAQRQSQLTEPVAIFIKQYMDTLRRLTMQDESLVELCKTIYRRHREAIDIIVEYGMIGAGQQAVEDVLSKEGDYENLCSRTNSVWFLPKSWSEIIPENSTRWRHLCRRVSIACFFQFRSSINKVRLICEVSQMDDPKLRLTCVNKLQKAGFKFTKKAFEEHAKYSRFYSKSLIVSDITDYEAVSEAIEKLLNKAKAEFPKAKKVFREVFSDSKS